MVGENRIIAFGAGNGDAGDEQRRVEDGIGSDATGNDAAPEGGASATWDEAWVAPAEDADARPETHGRSIVPAGAAGGAVACWTVFLIVAHWPLRSVPLAQWPAVVAQWSGPVLLVGVIWLLAMRHSTREARRFGDAARVLSVESALLERRLTAVNRELSLAREFIASQSRDLETLGRLAAERLSQNAERLQDLVRENGARVESIGTVSSAALENMEKLRGQLPVIASSAKDVTNNIANAGRTAHAQIEDMVHGFNRLNEFGAASTRQVSLLRDQVNETLDGFGQRSRQLDDTVAARFATLAERGEEFRAQLDRHEVEALAAIRTRARALTEEIDQSRHQLDRQEAESITSLRARLVALRDESDVVSRALRQGEERATDALKAALADVSDEQSAACLAIAEVQQTALDALAARLATISAEARQIDESIGLRAERLGMEAEERQSRQVEQERHAIARIGHMLAELDGTIAERLERHRIQTAALAERAGAVTGEMERFEGRLEAIAAHTGTSERQMADSLATLTERLGAARSTLAVTDGEVAALTEGSVRLLELIQGSARQTQDALPEALSVSEDRMRRLHDALGTVVAKLGEAHRGSDAVAAGIVGSRQNLDTLADALAQAQTQIGARGAEHATLLSGLLESLTEIDARARATADQAGGALADAIGALGRTIEETVTAIEDDSAERIGRVAQTLGEESAAAIDRAMRTRVAEISGRLEQAVAHASGVTREATVQLREQLGKVDELAGNLEKRIAQAREQAEEQVDNDFARRAAVITESLNSNAIDIASVLSTDIADTAWAAYLRGDRGIFTRRAVSLLDAGEAKTIQQVFERDDAFRVIVSRYIHDFEGILRQVLSTRDGNALGVTLLSSDMGKLYVALAQAIERLRN